MIQDPNQSQKEGQSLSEEELDVVVGGVSGFGSVSDIELPAPYAGDDSGVVVF